MENELFFAGAGCDDAMLVGGVDSGEVCESDVSVGVGRSASKPVAIQIRARHQVHGALPWCENAKRDRPRKLAHVPCAPVQVAQNYHAKKTSTEGSALTMLLHQTSEQERTVTRRRMHKMLQRLELSSAVQVGLQRHTRPPHDAFIVADLPTISTW